MVDGIFQHTRNRTVVLRRNHNDAMLLLNLLLEFAHSRRLIAIQILIVQRQITDFNEFSHKVLWQQFHQGLRQFPIDRILTQAAYNNTNLYVAMYILSRITMRTRWKTTQ